MLEPQDIEELTVILNKLGAKEYSQKVSAELESESLALFNRAGVSKSGVENIRILVNDYFNNNH